MVKTIRAGRGLGDSIYLASICSHLGQQKRRLRVMSDYPTVFDAVAGVEAVEPFRRIGVDIVAHYAAGKTNKKSTQFDDMCRSANLPDICDLALPWRPGPLPEEVARLGRYLCVQMPRAPMNRTDGFGAELMPKPRVLQEVIAQCARALPLVLIGAGPRLFEVGPIAVDMSNRTTVKQMIDIARCSVGLVGFPSFIIPLAESFRRPVFCLWARAGLSSNTAFIQQITPTKLFHHVDDDYFSVDDLPTEVIASDVETFLRRL